MIEQIRKIFDQTLVKKFGEKREILNFLINHPRKQICLENLCAQIQLAERKLLSIVFNVEIYKKTIHDIALMFAGQALRKAEEDQLSSIERIRREEQNRTIERANECVEEIEKGLSKKILGEGPDSQGINS